MTHPLLPFFKNLKKFTRAISLLFLLSGGQIFSNLNAQVASIGTASFVSQTNTLSGFTVPAGTNRLLVVTASDAFANSMSGATFNGQPMVEQREHTDGFAVDAVYTYVLGSNGSASSGNTIVITSGNASHTAKFISATVFANVDQSTPASGAQSVHGSVDPSSSTLNVVSSSGDLVFDIFDYVRETTTGANTAAVGGGQSFIVNQGPLTFGSIFEYYSTSQKAGASNVSMSRTTTNGEAHIHIALNLKQGACSPPTFNTPSVTQPTCSTPTGTIVINTSNSGSFEYSVNNGANWQTSPTFSGLASGNYNLKARLQANTSCESTYGSNPVVLNSAFTTSTTTDTWTGCVSTDWHTAANWSDNSVPTAADDVKIPNVTNDPVLSAAAVAKTVHVQSGAMLTIAAAGSLEVNGSFPGFFGETTAFYNQGSVSNDGTLNIGSVSSTGQSGLTNNNGTINNNASGQIFINRSSDAGFVTYSGNTTNAGYIEIGGTQSIGNYGLFSQSTVTNTASGQIVIDRAASRAVYFFGGSGINYGDITIGTSGNVGQYSIDITGSTFNNSGCSAFINILSNSIIRTVGSGNPTFSNSGTIVENASGTSNITNNSGIVQNLNGGTFTIINNTGELTTATGDIWTGCVSTDWHTAGNWLDGSVPTASDNATISNVANDPTISAAVSANIVNVSAGAVLNIASGGSLAALNLTNSGTVENDGSISLTNASPIYMRINNKSGSVFNNHGTLVCGTAGSARASRGIFNQGNFNNLAGSLSIDKVGWGITSIGAIVNNATITIGASVDSTAISCSAPFSNSPCTALINIFATSNQTQTISSSGLNNAGGIIVRSNQGSFIPTNSGVIQNLGTGTFSITTNTGTLTPETGDIWMGCTSTDWDEASNWLDGSVPTAADNTMILNQPNDPEITTSVEAKRAFVNGGVLTVAATGVLTINGSTLAGIFNTGTVSNAGEIWIGTLSTIGTAGIQSSGTFQNSGLIDINRTNGFGLLNTQATANFQNSGQIHLGLSASIGNYGLGNQTSATFTNLACGEILTNYPVFVGVGTLTNNGLFKINTTSAHGSNDALINNGILEYPQGNQISGVTNNEIIAAPISGGCSISPALSLGTTVDFNIATDWFLDENLTMPAGTFNEMTNTFSNTNLTSGVPTTVYFEIEDAVGGCTQVVSIQITSTCAPCSGVTAEITGEEDFCASPGNFVTLTATISTTADTYLWDDNSTDATRDVSQIGAVNYSVTVTDTDGCTATAEFTVTGLVPPTPSITGINSICSGESTILNASGGGDYEWSTGDMDDQIETPDLTTSTTYLLTVTAANGCYATVAKTVFVKKLPVVNITGTTTLCEGESTKLTATLFNSTYLWDPTGATTSSITVAPLVTTTYTVTLTSNSTGCSNTGSVTVNLTGPCTCELNNQFTNPGFEDNKTGWTTAGSSTVISSPLADIHGGTKALRICNVAANGSQRKAALPQQTFTFSGWAKGSGTNNKFVGVQFLGSNLTVLQETNQTINSTAYQQFSLEVTAPEGTKWIKPRFVNDAGTGCLFVDDLCLVLTVPPLPKNGRPLQEGIVEQQFDIFESEKLERLGYSDFLLFPNPTSDVLNLVFSKDEAVAGQVEVFNSIGKRVLIQNLRVEAGEEANLPVGHLPEGAYFLLFKKDDGSTSGERFFKI